MAGWLLPGSRGGSLTASSFRKEYYIMEKYVKPQLDIIDLNKEDTILTSSSCDVIVSWTVTWEDGNGNVYSNSGN